MLQGNSAIAIGGGRRAERSLDGHLIATRMQKESARISCHTSEYSQASGRLGALAGERRAHASGGYSARGFDYPDGGPGHGLQAGPVYLVQRIHGVEQVEWRRQVVDDRHAREVEVATVGCGTRA